MNVRKFLLKKFPTNKYMDCPVAKNYYGIMQEYAEVYHESKVKELNLACVVGQSELLCPNCGCNKYQTDATDPNKCINCGELFRA